MNNLDIPNQPPETLLISPISYKWIPINSAENIPYCFPDDITDYMKSRYGFPALYRWIIDRKDGSVFYYLGETDGLIPRRINQYLKPGPSQKTNLRLNEVFYDEIKKGTKIRLEYLTFSPFTINEFKFSHSSLTDVHVRRFLEKLFTILSLATGERLLNR